MNTIEAIKGALEPKLMEEDIFLVDIQLSPNNKMQVFLDTDEGITIDKCARVSRYLNTYIEQEQLLGDNYSLDVSSPGIEQPLKLVRQYKKNIGRKIAIRLLDGSDKKGILKKVTEDNITIEQENKIKDFKKKVFETIIAFGDIQNTKVLVTFKL